MAYCTDALSRAWMRMVSLLFLPFRFLFWIKMAILYLILGGLNPFNYITQRLSDFNNPADLRQLMDNFIERLPLLLVIIILFVIGSILFSLLYAAARFIFYDSVHKGTCYYMESFYRHGGGILSYLLWNIAVFLIFSIITLVIILLTLIVGFLFESLMGIAGVILVGVFAVALALLLAIAIILYWTLLDAMVLPMMVVERVGIFQAWGRALSLAFTRIGEFAGFLLVRFLVNLTLAVILFLIGIFIAGASLLIALLLGADPDPNVFNQFIYSAAALPIWLILAVIQLPFPVFLDSYALYFMAALTGKSEYRPKGDHGHDDETDSDTAQPTKWTPPPSTGSTPPSTMGPVSFADIPSEPKKSEPPIEGPPQNP